MPRKKGRKSKKKTRPPPDIPRQHCQYCSEELDTVFIKCKDCEDVILCLKCFSSGAELGNHLKSHSYHVLNPLHKISISNPLSKWKAEHEFKLLHFILWWGYGNWEQISKELGSLGGEPRFTPEEVQQHYEDVYVEGPLGKDFWDADKESNLIDHTHDGNDPCFSEILPPPMSETAYEVYKKTLGYMPRREDFEIEYEEEAELGLIDKKAPYSSKDEIESGFKNAAFSMYNETLKKRLSFKSFAREHDKVQEFFRFDGKPRPEPSSLTGSVNSFQEFKEKMVPFTRFFSKQQFQDYYVNNQKEKELKNRIKELKRMRELGCTTFEEARQAGIQYNPITKKMPANAPSVLEPSSQNKIEEGRQLSSIEIVPGMGVQSTQVMPRRMTARDYLTAREKILCDTLKILPGQYIVLKAFILRMDYLRQRGGEVFFPLSPGLTKYHYSKIITYMGNSGWINAPYLLQLLCDQE